MKTIGMIGGMSWESSAVYYRIINERVKALRGGLHSARSLMYSVDFSEIAALQHKGQWAAAGGILADAARRLERCGADLLVLCTNTMHIIAEQVAEAVSIPLLHIADPTAAAIRRREVETVGLLGTRFTMEQDFYKGRLTKQHGLKVLVPEAKDRELVHSIIYEELCLGDIRAESKAAYLQVIERLRAAGAQGIILGCTEIDLLINQGDSDLPLFDTTQLHAEAAVDAALAVSS